MIDYEFREIQGHPMTRYKICNYRHTTLGWPISFDNNGVMPYATSQVKANPEFQQDPDIKEFLDAVFAPNSISSSERSVYWEPLVGEQTPWVYDGENKILCAYFMDTRDHPKGFDRIELHGDSFLYLDSSIEKNFLLDDDLHTQAVILKYGPTIVLSVVFVEAGIAYITPRILSAAELTFWRNAAAGSVALAGRCVVEPVVSSKTSEVVDRLEPDDMSSEIFHSRYLDLTDSIHLRPTPDQRGQFISLPEGTNVIEYAQLMKGMFTRITRVGNMFPFHVPILLTAVGPDLRVHNRVQTYSDGTEQNYACIHIASVHVVTHAITGDGAIYNGKVPAPCGNNQ